MAEIIKIEEEKKKRIGRTKSKGNHKQDRRLRNRKRRNDAQDVEGGKRTVQRKMPAGS